MIIAQTLLCFEYTRNISVIFQQLHIKDNKFLISFYNRFFFLKRDTCACKCACNCEVYGTHLTHYD